MDPNKLPRKLWEHPDPKSTAMWKFMQDLNRSHGLTLDSFQDLYKWSCQERAKFYGFLWESQNFIHEGSYSQVVDESVPVSELPRWFAGVRLNWAENFLWTTGPDGGRSTVLKEDHVVAATEIREGNTEVKHLTWGELRRTVHELATALQMRGVMAGDRVVMIGAHSIQTLVVFLATTWLGGVFSSSSTDMGIGGLLQRTTQIDPKFIFFDDGALYNGKILDLRDKISGVMDGMKQCSAFKAGIIVQRFGKPYETTAISSTERLEDFLRPAQTSKSPKPDPVRVGFQDPMMVYYSSGTTGTPKAIVHAVGPLLVNSMKDSALHRNMTNRDVGLQFTTTGWIMYLASVGQMLSGGRAVIYDGSPLMPDLKVLLKIVEQQKVTHLGISPRWLGELMRNNVVPRESADLSTLSLVTCTGMVLPDQLFEWFYDVGFPKSVHLANMSGGTDIAGCFAMDNPLTPVYVGGCQGGCLGVPISVYDHDLPEGSAGKPLPDGMAGDLVSPAAFPNIPVFLWGDSPSRTNAPGAKYQSSYFSRFKDVWTQGDFVAIHPLTGGIYMLGRSDGVLNPSGVRFGSADVYAVLERCMPAEIADSLCVGQMRPRDTDERVVLFLLMKPGVTLDKKMVQRVRSTIAKELTKRHVPKYVFEVFELPVTVNGKKVELPVKHIISGKTIKPSGTLLNPKSLDFFYQFQEIEKLDEPRAKL